MYFRFGVNGLQVRPGAVVKLSMKYETRDEEHYLEFDGTCENHTPDGRVRIKGSFLAPDDNGLVRRIWFEAKAALEDAKMSASSAIPLDQCTEVAVSSRGPVVYDLDDEK